MLVIIYLIGFQILVHIAAFSNRLSQLSEAFRCFVFWLFEDFLASDCYDNQSLLGPMPIIPPLAGRNKFKS